MPNVLIKEKKFTDAERKMPKLRCPVCSARLLDAKDASVRRRTRLFLYRGESDARFVIKCTECKSRVGIREATEPLDASE